MLTRNPFQPVSPVSSDNINSKKCCTFTRNRPKREEKEKWKKVEWRAPSRPDGWTPFLFFYFFAKPTDTHHCVFCCVWIRIHSHYVSFVFALSKKVSHYVFRSHMVRWKNTVRSILEPFWENPWLFVLQWMCAFTPCEESWEIFIQN